MFLVLKHPREVMILGELCNFAGAFHIAYHFTEQLAHFIFVAVSLAYAFVEAIVVVRVKH
jgi:hypothetical protein